ncbi:MAG: hypothetical protein ABJC39_07015 [Chloroflexota bacterium]
MVTVRIEHPVKDFTLWKAAFDRDPADRQGSGVERYAIQVGSDAPNDVSIDLDFANVAAAEAFLVTMRGIWGSPPATAALAGAPSARILVDIERREVAPAGA